MPDGGAPRRAPKKHPEHDLQTMLVQFVRAAVPVSHVFLAFDRAQSSAGFTHAREAARGIRRGTPDTVLMIADAPDFWCELKIRPNKPDDAQIEVMDDIRSVGRAVTVAYSVDEYRVAALAAGIPMTPGAAVMAMRMDALLESKRAKNAPPKRSRASGTREARASAAQIKRVATLRDKLPF